MKLSKSKVLSDHEIEMIHNASLEILKDVGLMIKSTDSYGCCAFHT